MTWEISLGDILTMAGGAAAAAVFMRKQGKSEGFESAEIIKLADEIKSVGTNINEVNAKYSTLDNKIESKYAELNASIHTSIAQVQAQFQLEIEKHKDKLSAHVLESSTKYTLLDAKLQNIDRMISEEVKPTLQNIQNGLTVINNKLHQ